jgi:S1-C subfamily serine protease
MPGQRVVLRIQRGANQLDVAVSTEEESDHLQDLADTLDPSKNTVPELGIVGLDLTRDVRQYMPDARRPAGVVVAARNADVPYSASHLEISDIIYEVNRHVVANVDELRNTLQNMKSGDAVVLLVERDGRLVYVPLELN